MELRIYRPEGYSFGAHKIEATLSETEKDAYAAWPISFHFPVMPKRRLHTEMNFVVAATTEAGTELRGVFVDGEWISHVYSNGIAEDENPTKIGEFEKNLRESIFASVKISVDAYAETQKWRNNA